MSSIVCVQLPQSCDQCWGLAQSHLAGCAISGLFPAGGSQHDVSIIYRDGGSPTCGTYNEEFTTGIYKQQYRVEGACAWESCRVSMGPKASSLGVLCGPSKSTRSLHTYLTGSPGPEKTQELSSHPEHLRKGVNILISWEMTCACSCVHTCVEGREHPWLSFLRHYPPCFLTRPLTVGLDLTN